MCVSVLNDAVAQRWHAPVGAVPDEVLLRRRIAVRVWSVVELTDEVDRRPVAEGDPRHCRGPNDWSDDPLMAELDRARSAEMRDIVATIQREQYDAMSAGYDRTLVVQGGPYTGLYVALTRCTQRLVVVSSRALPRELGGSVDVPTSGPESARGVDTDLARLLDLVTGVPSEDRLLVSALLERFATLAEPAVDGVADGLVRRGGTDVGPVLSLVPGVPEQR